MENLMLEKLLLSLNKAKDNQTYNYTVPDLWNCFDYDKDKFIKTNSNELMVNPYDFYSSVIKDFILPLKNTSTNYHKSLSIGTNKKLPKTNFK